MNNNGRYILDENHNVIPCPDLLEWAQWLETANRVVKQEKVGNSRVSTVFLGLDHSFAPGKTPILFETVIFDGEYDQYQKRCATWKQAEKIHEHAVKMLKGK